MFDLENWPRYPDRYDVYVRKLHEAGVPVCIRWNGHYWWPTASLGRRHPSSDFDELLAFAGQKRAQCQANVAEYPSQPWWSWAWPVWVVRAVPVAT